jgi:hypothetical protein
VSDSCSVDVNDISECGRVPKSAPDVPVGTCRETDIEKQYEQLCKKKLVVQLKRLDENIRKFYDTVVSKKVEDVDKLVLEVDDIEFDDDLLKKLLQKVLQLEPVSELPPQQLPVERGRRDIGSEEGSVREVSPPQVAASGEGTEKVLLIV